MTPEERIIDALTNTVSMGSVRRIEAHAKMLGMDISELRKNSVDEKGNDE